MKKVLMILLLALSLLPVFATETIAPNIKPDNMDPAKNRVRIVQLVASMEVSPRVGFTESRVTSVIQPTNIDKAEFKYDSLTDVYSVRLFSYVQVYGSAGSLGYEITVSDMTSGTEIITPNMSVNNNEIGGYTYSSQVMHSDIPQVVSDEILLSIPFKEVTQKTKYTGSLVIKVVNNG